MYCRKCGKEIDYDAEICLECQGHAHPIEEHDSYAEENYYASMYAESKAKKAGLARAITAACLGVVACVMSNFAMSSLSALIESWGQIIDSAIVAVAYVLAFLSLGGAIPGLINGIKSIKCFKDAKKNALPKPVATLILGIGATVTSSVSIVYFIATFFAGMFLLMI